MLRDSVSHTSGEWATFVDVVRARAAERATQLAYTFLSERGVETGRWTYADLAARAQAIAARLQALGAPGTPVLLLYPPGLEFIAAFTGCLLAGAVAVPVFPPRRNQFGARLQQIAGDVGAELALVCGASLAATREACSGLPALERLRLLASDELELDEGVAWRDPHVTPETLALLQYTSGSTSTPKGVMLDHANLLHNQAAIHAAFEHDEHTVVVGWLPLYHDMGLIGNVLQPLYAGATCVLMPPAAFLLRPARWLEAITRYRATTSGAPDFAYDLCVRKVSEAERASLDLSSWTLAYSGAEPVRARTLGRFAEAFAGCGFRREAFYPCYGLAEATLFVSGGAKAAAPALSTLDEGDTLVGCGHAWAGQELRIVEPETCAPLADGEAGEIWLRGPSVAQGYWKRAEESEATFGARLASGEGPFLRTGDIGFLRAGQLFVQGRVKELIIIRGVNHHPHDVEASLEGCHEALRARSAAAFSVEAEGEERLVVVAEVEREARGVDVGAVATAVRAAISEAHDLQLWALVLLRPGGLPRTTSGKLRRAACRAAFLADTLDALGSVQSGARPSLRGGGTAALDASLQAR